jgi:PAS domain S-box-containing protein
MVDASAMDSRPVAAREQELRLLTEHSSDFLARLSPSLAFRYASPACRSLIGYTPEELAGRDARTLVIAADRPALRTAAADLQERGLPVLGAVFALGADGELTMEEIWLRMAEVAAAGGFAGARGLTAPVAQLLAKVIQEVPTEASAQALRCFADQTGTVEIRQGRRTVPLSPAGAITYFFDVLAALESGATLAKHVRGAESLDEANERLRALGVRTELDYEREMAAEP